jgi:hypothetical protein
MELGCSLHMANASVGASLAMVQRIGHPELAVELQNARERLQAAQARLDQITQAEKQQIVIPL